MTCIVEISPRVQKIVLLSLIIINCIVYAVMIFFNIAAGQPIGIFKNKTGDISDANQVNITPAGATFATWGVIYAWQTLWLIYNVVLIFLKKNNNRLYYDPPVLTITFHIFILFNFIFNAGWLALWDSQYFSASLALIVLMLLTLYIAAFISHKNIVRVESYLEDRRWVIWLYRLLVNNGLAFYAAWLTVATLLNLAIAITYEWARKQFYDNYHKTYNITKYDF